MPDEDSLHPSFLPTLIFLWIYCWGHRLEDLWARRNLKNHFLRVTKCWLTLWLKIIMCSKSIKGRKCHNFTFLFWKTMSSSITKLVFWQGNNWLELSNGFHLPFAGAPPSSSWHGVCSSMTIYHSDFQIAFLNLLSGSFNSFNLPVHLQGSICDDWVL